MPRETGHEGPAVVALDGVLLAIVQCMASPSDILAFLQALVASAVELPPALSALRVLLTTPRLRRTLADLWPRVHLAGIADDEIHLVATAMPIIPSIGIGGPFGRDRWPISDKAGLFTDPFCAFIAPWTFKVHELGLFSGRAQYPSDFYHLLGICTNLQTATLSCNWLALAAISTSAHHVSDLSLLNASYNVDGLPFDWTESLGPWLESAQTKRLRLSSFASTDDLGLARALATTRTLTQLHLDDADDVINGLLANRLPLHYLTHLRLPACREPILGDMAALLDPLVIESIRLQSFCLEEMTGFFMALPLFTRLSTVDISGVSVSTHDAAPLPTTKTLRVVQFRAISWSTNALATLLDWTARANHLACCNWSGSEMVGANCDLVGCALRCWIASGALHTASFRCCSIDDGGVRLLALALCDVHPRTQLKLDLSVNRFGCDGLHVLLDALATSSNIVVLTSRIEMPEDFARRGVAIDTSMPKTLRLTAPMH